MVLMLLKLEKNTGCTTLQVLGYSLLVIEWITHKRPARNIYLRPIYDEIIPYLCFFWDITFHHTYWERNTIADHLSKRGLFLTLGNITAWDTNNDTIK